MVGILRMIHPPLVPVAPQGLDRQLSANGLARLLAAAGRLSLLEAMAVDLTVD